MPALSTGYRCLGVMVKNRIENCLHGHRVSKIGTCVQEYLIDKILISLDECIGGMFLPVKAYLGIGKAGLAIRLGTEGGTSAALLRNQHTVWSSHRQ